jgi:hypothetical protein
MNPPATIHLAFVEGLSGTHIKKWDREPFEGSTAYDSGQALDARSASSIGSTGREAWMSWARWRWLCNRGSKGSRANWKRYPNPPAQLEDFARRPYVGRPTTGVRIMGKIIAAVALVGWGIIAWIAWHQADARIADCGATLPEPSCIVHATAQRDFIMTIGLLGALLIVLASLIIYAKARRGQSARFAYVRLAASQSGAEGAAALGA